VDVRSASLDCLEDGLSLQAEGVLGTVAEVPTVLLAGGDHALRAGHDGRFGAAFVKLCHSPSRMFLPVPV
jgi:hypothetical protein